MEKAAKGAAKTHKERVAEFNEKLENLSEHYDIPKVRGRVEVTVTRALTLLLFLRRSGQGSWPSYPLSAAIGSFITKRNYTL